MNIARALVATFAMVAGPSHLSAQSTPGDQRPIGILLAAGDISSCDDKDKPKSKQKPYLSYANKTANVIRKVLKDSEAKDGKPAIPVRVLVLGDLAYGDGTEQEFKCFDSRWSGLKDVMLPVPGNHDYHTEEGKYYYEYFKDHPFVNQVGPKKGYYALNFPREDGPWRLIAINDNFLYKKKYKKEMDAQRAWLETKLDINDKKNRQNCVLAFWHAPTFTSGRHGRKEYSNTNPDSPLTEKRPMKGVLDTLYRHGASAVLAGHEHSYEQFSPHDAEGKPVTDGIRAFVVGTGGSELTADGFDTNAPNSEGHYGKKKGVQGLLKIELFDDWYRWEFLAIEQKAGEKKSLDLKVTKDTCRTRKKPT